MSSIIAHILFFSSTNMFLAVIETLFFLLYDFNVFNYLYIIPPKIIFEEETIELRAYLLEYLINFYLLYVDINIYI